MTSGPRPSTLWWRLSIVVAAGLIGGSLWLIYELVGELRFWWAVIEFLGGKAQTNWPGLALLFAGIGAIGILLPGLYLRRAWSRAFPNLSARPSD